MSSILLCQNRTQLGVGVKVTKRHVSKVSMTVQLFQCAQQRRGRGASRVRCVVYKATARLEGTEIGPDESDRTNPR